MSDRRINKVPVFAGQMGIVAIMGATRDRSRIGSARLGQGLLKANLPGLARLPLFQGGVLHLRQSCLLPFNYEISAPMTSMRFHDI
ncbi:hypothetical protein [Rhizobium tibeticum]|uniref:hypothetical protein n=1 Tax=Rhizobium tibeticum TaxID=501024 RepID=UPI000931CED9|nr:hypothetical protein [Rhizobium tibeticum]